MTMLTAFAAAGLIARLCFGAPPPGDVQIEGNVRYDVGTERVVVSDGAVLRRGAIVLRAGSATYDPATGEVRATGGVLLTDATHAIAADSVRAILGGEMEAEGVVAFVKDQPVDLSRATTLSEARGLGRNRLSFSGARLTGDPAGHFRLGDARLTLCDCGEGRIPSWEVTARSADVLLGKRAILSGGVLRIAVPFLHRSVPVPLLSIPWLYLPLGERQSGLLLPEIFSVPSTGLRISEPVFLTLGRSADATLAPEYASGGHQTATQQKGRVRGPGARLELRWAPAEGAEGRAQLSWMHDLEREAYGVGGDRFAFDAAHLQRLSPDATVAAALRLTKDPVWVRDMGSDDLARSVPYLRSDVLLSRRSDVTVIEGGASYLEPLRPNGIVAGESFGVLGSDLRTASRWPSAAATLLPVFAGRLQLSGRGGVTRFAPVAAAYDVFGRPAADRADARLEVSAPLLLWRALSVTPYARGAVLAYAFEAERDPSATAWGVAGAALSTEVSRRFGSARHVITPRLEWRAGSAASGATLAWPAYDELDRSDSGLLSAVPGPFNQARAAVETRLEVSGKEIVRLEAGQDLDLRSGRFAETFGGASVSAGPFRADASMRALAIDGRAAPAAPAPVPTPLDRFTEFRASAGLADHRGDAVSASVFSVGPGGSGLLVAGVDPLFDLRPGNVQPSAAGSSGVRIAAGSALLGYDVMVIGPNYVAPLCSGGQRVVRGWEVWQHAATLTWTSRCRCFRLLAHASVDGCGGLSYGASIDLSSLAGATRIR